MESLGPLRFSVKHSVLLLQPKNPGLDRHGATDRTKTLRVDLRDGSMSTLLGAAPLPADSPLVLGVIGLLNLHGGSVLALVTKAKQVGTGAAARQ